MLYLDDVEQAAVLLKPLRLDVLRAMQDAVTCNELAARLDVTPQKVHYHVKALESAGLVERVSERKVRGILEGSYRARARSYWLSPHLVGRLGGARAATDQVSLGYLIQLAEQVQDEVAALASSVADGEEVPSLGLSAQITLRDGADRAAFRRDVEQAFRRLAETYGARADDAGDAQRLALVCYPKEHP